MKVNSRSNKGFAAGTLVVMADGKTKPIEEIKTGDYVLSFNEYDADAPLEPMRVLDTFERIDNNVLVVKVGETTLKVAQDQMFIGPHNDWKQVYNHTMIVDADGIAVAYEVSQIKTGKHKIYDITVDKNHSLIANGLRVHNGGGGGGGGGSSAGSSIGGAVGSAVGSKLGGSLGGQIGGAIGSKVGGSLGGGLGGGGGFGGKTSNKSSGGSMGGGGNGFGGGGGAEHGSRGIGPHNPNSSSTGKIMPAGGFGYSGGFKKKKKKKEEPDPAKPNGSSVSSKLIDTIGDNLAILEGLVSILDPVALTAARVTVQTTIDVSYQFAQAFLASVIASELSSYDKGELIQTANEMIVTFADMRKPFEQNPVTAAGQKLALTLLVVQETYVIKCKIILGAYTTFDKKGSFSVSVNGNSSTGGNPEPYYYKPIAKYVPGNGGKYKPAPAKKQKIRGKIQANSNGSRGLEGTGRG